MKTSSLIGGLIILVLAVFTTLYFVKPRVVTEEKIVERIVEKIPDSVSMQFGPAEPDTTYDAIIDDVDGNGVSLIASRKTFKEALLSKDGEVLADVTSEVIAYGPMPAYLLENNISADFNKDNIAEEIRKSIPKGDSKFVEGMIIGGASVVVLAGSIYLIAHATK